LTEQVKTPLRVEGRLAAPQVVLPQLKGTKPLAHA
jgi:hypothetical protein